MSPAIKTKIGISKPSRPGQDQSSSNHRPSSPVIPSLAAKITSGGAALDYGSPAETPTDPSSSHPSRLSAAITPLLQRPTSPPNGSIAPDRPPEHTVITSSNPGPSFPPRESRYPERIVTSTRYIDTDWHMEPPPSEPPFDPYQERYRDEFRDYRDYHEYPDSRDYRDYRDYPSSSRLPERDHSWEQMRARERERLREREHERDRYGWGRMSRRSESPPPPVSPTSRRRRSRTPPPRRFSRDEQSRVPETPQAAVRLPRENDISIRPRALSTPEDLASAILPPNSRVIIDELRTPGKSVADWFVVAAEYARRRDFHNSDRVRVKL